MPLKLGTTWLCCIPQGFSFLYHSKSFATERKDISFTFLILSSSRCFTPQILLFIFIFLGAWGRKVKVSCVIFFLDTFLCFKETWQILGPNQSPVQWKFGLIRWKKDENFWSVATKIFSDEVKNKWSHIFTPCFPSLGSRKKAFLVTLLRYLQFSYPYRWWEIVLFYSASYLSVFYSGFETVGDR